MLNPKEQAEIQQIAVGTQKEYKLKLRRNNNSIYAVNLSSDLHVKIDKLVEDTKNTGVRFGCENGCSYCCTLRVEALAPEVFYIAKKLKANLTQTQLVELTESLSVYSDRARGLSQTEHRIPCPLLLNGRCSIYDYRPAMCRKFNSLDAEICKDPTAEIPENLGIVAKGSAIFHGFMEAYSGKKLSSMPHELGQALLVAITNQTAEENWFKGEVVFEPLPEKVGL